MAIYLLLIVFILLLPIIVNSKKQDHKNKIITSVGMTAIFLILALKGDVGSDISGYLEQYYISASKDWHNVDYVYFESGYIYLMKIFSKSGCSFQLYMAFVYALACFAMYLFIRKYSLNPTFSLLIFVCYMFFVFYISGVRQTIAMSLCILAFITLQKKKRTTFVISSLMILLSTTIHQSAIVFFGILLLQLIKNKRINIFL